METCCNYTDNKRMYVSTDERWLINRILRFAEQKPDDVIIIKNPEENDGCLYCSVPTSWLKITPPAKRELTEEQKASAKERMTKMWENRKKGG